MNEESENQSISINIVDLFLGYMTILFNICIILILFTKIKNRENNIKILKQKLFFLIIFDTISNLLYNNRIFFLNSLASDIIFGWLSLIEFYLFLYFIYEIYNCTEINVLAKKPKTMNPIYLAITLGLLNFPLYKYTKNVILNIFNLFLILCCFLILYFYFNKTSKNISKHLMAGDFQTKKVYSYLNMINIYCVFILFCYNFTKGFLLFINPENIKFVEIALTVFNYGIKYYVFILSTLIIYTLNKKSYKRFNEEIITIMNQGIYSS